MPLLDAPIPLWEKFELSFGTLPRKEVQASDHIMRVSLLYNPKKYQNTDELGLGIALMNDSHIWEKMAKSRIE